MTFSILAYDQKTGVYGGAAATGSLCVGGWVLRGDAESGLSASQGTSPSTLWGTAVLADMRDGATASAAVEAVTSPDTGRAHRQLAALDPKGRTGAFTGGESIAFAGSIDGPQAVAAGNMLTSEAVLTAALAAFGVTEGAMAARLIAALKAAEAAGGDSRGLLSAALLVVGRDMAPLTLRIDHSGTPLDSLAALYRQSQTEPYRSWTAMVPTLTAPYRTGVEVKQATARG